MFSPETIITEQIANNYRPTLSPEIYKKRREEFLSKLGNGVAIFPSAPTTIRTNDTDYRYRQNSDLYYLTGFTEPETVCLLAPNHLEHKFVLFVRPRNEEKEIWEGRRVGPEGAKELLGADATYEIEKLDEELPKYLEKVDFIYYSLGNEQRFDQRIINLIKYFRSMRRRNGVGPYSIIDPTEILQEMRLIKTPEELELMRRSATIAAQAHLAAMKAVKVGMYEFEIEAVIEHYFRRSGANAPAYNSIVGAGANATILHYVENNCQIKDNDLLLVDAGAEYEHYCSDITRTYPANGRFTKEQKEIYEIVLAAQLAAIEKVKPGAAFDDVHQAALDIIVDGLFNLGLLSGEREKVIEEKQYQKFFMHRTSHWLGIDTHDVGKYKQSDESRILEPGMILTVEPGIYIRPMDDVPTKYHNIGIRIEDDVLVTEQGSEILTAFVPKQINELEAIIGRGN
ncbi:MAG: Xaa-Pro aminopeptidase [Blastocatellia bacterium]|nr:Xaa-Pro aminopeptidase [Blastocatellia bacterium]